MAAVSKFTNAGGKYRTLSLFWEMASFDSDKSECLYTLRDEDYRGLPSLKRLYLEKADPTEYSFASEYLGGWGHWQAIVSTTWFQPHALRWRSELEIKLRSEALTRLREEANSGSRNAFQANRFLALGGWLPKETKRKVGRPSTEAIKQEAAELFEFEKSILADHDRLN